MSRLRILPNGVRIVTDPMKSVRSCAIGIWVDVGSRHEAEADGGLSHFVEHMLFKGTRRLDTRQIADATNELGGNLNAFTTQEQLVLHARTIDRKAPRALDLMAEMLLESIFPDDELARERQVIIEECKMYEDSPEELSVDVFMRNLWPDHPLGRPVIGRRSTIRRFSAGRLRAYWGQELQPARVLISLAGAFDAAAVDEVIRRRFEPLAESRHAARPAQTSPRCLPRRQSCLKRTIEQSHSAWAPTPPPPRPDRQAFGLMNMILGAASARVCSWKCARNAAWLTRSAPSPRSSPMPAVLPSTAPPAPPRWARSCGSPLMKSIESAKKRYPSASWSWRALR